jgi:hypothetical protein
VSRLGSHAALVIVEDLKMLIGTLARSLALAGFVALLAGSQASAISFTCVRNSGFSESECLIGEAQFSAEVSDLGGGQVSITFSNTGSDPAIIADVYIDDDASLFSSIGSVLDGAGTDFEIGASPGDLPGGNEATPVFSANFSADAEAPTGTGGNGADPGESFSLIMNLAGGKTFADAQAAFELGTTRLGIHGQGLGETGGSEAFVTGGGGGENAVPEPTAALLFGLGLVAVSRRVRRG